MLRISSSLVAILLSAAVAWAQGTTPASSQWTRHFGTVEKIEGNTLTFKEDGGQMFTVDVTQIEPKARAELKRGDVVTVIGMPGAQATRFTAGFVEKGKGWDRVHGTVEKVQGTTATVKADDGKSVTVNLSQLGESARGSVKAGDKVTLIGYNVAATGRFDAHRLHPDSAPAASPPTR